MAANVVLSAVGHNLRRILAWLQVLWCFILTELIAVISVRPALNLAS
jgi:IS5 family transposase